jgi:hypothetical protein
MSIMQTRIVPATLTIALALAGAVHAARSFPATDRVADVLKGVRDALGGESKIAAITSIRAEGPFRRMLGTRDLEGTLILTIVRPDKLHRSEEMTIGGMVGGPTIERLSALNGDTAWDDTANRGGMGGGMQIVLRDGPGPGGPGAGGPGPGGAGPGGGGPALTPEQINEARVRRMKVQLHRWLVALLADSTHAFADGGVAESPDGRADILETTEDSGRMLRLFIDQSTHLPLMIQYQDPRPVVMTTDGPGRGPGGPGTPGPGTMTSEEMQKRAEELRRQPPQIGTYTMHLGDYKKVGGVMLPHRIQTSLEGQPNEEWTIEKFVVNPSVKASLFEKK